MAQAKKKIKKALPRRERGYPQAVRVFSTLFLDNMLSQPSKGFVPLDDYLKLQKKYLSLYKRYKREK